MKRQLSNKNLLKKFIFFYVVANFFAYGVFLLKFNPQIENDDKRDYQSEYVNSITLTKSHYFILIPDYDVIKVCQNCKLKESENFYPFHKFTFNFGHSNYYNGTSYHYNTKGFVGIFGFYGHTEFVFYIILPIVIYILSMIYKRYIQ